jgi:hypothetical protein
LGILSLRDEVRRIPANIATIAPGASWELHLPRIGFGDLLVFDDDAFFVPAFGAFERAPVVIRLVRLDSRQQHLRAASDARWSLD